MNNMLSRNVAKLILHCFICGTFAWLMPFSVVSQTTIFSTNFDGSLPLGVSGSGILVSVQGYAGLGQNGKFFTGNFLRNDAVGNPAAPITISLNNLPLHTHINIDMFLAIIDSWDGLTGNASPDILTITVDGTTVFQESFLNSASGSHPYNIPVGATLASQQDLGFNQGGAFYLDSGFDLRLESSLHNIPHTSSTLLIQIFAEGNGWQGLSDESFAIDNLEISIVQSNSVPALGTWGMIILGLVVICIGGIALKQREFQDRNSVKVA